MEADGKSSGPVSLATGPCSGDPGSANQTCPCAVWPLDQRGRVRILWEGCGAAVSGLWQPCAGAECSGGRAGGWSKTLAFPTRGLLGGPHSVSTGPCIMLCPRWRTRLCLCCLQLGILTHGEWSLHSRPEAAHPEVPQKAFRALPPTGGPTFLSPGTGVKSTGPGEGGSHVLRDC